TFHTARMMIVPVREEATLTIMLERDTAQPAVRAVLKNRLASLRSAIGSSSPESSMSAGSAPMPEPEDEVDRLMIGELGPVLREVQGVFTSYVVRAGKTASEARVMMRQQLREWLLMVNPSPYTFPVLV